MGWETRKGKGRYYTRSRRVNGRVVREYFGCGEAAERAAREDEERRSRNRRLKQRLLEQQALDAIIQAVADSGMRLFRRRMKELGYHRPYRGPWRKKRLPKPARSVSPSLAPVSAEPVRPSTFNLRCSHPRPLLVAELLRRRRRDRHGLRAQPHDNRRHQTPGCPAKGGEEQKKYCTRRLVTQRGRAATKVARASSLRSLPAPEGRRRLAGGNAPGLPGQTSDRALEGREEALRSQILVGTQRIAKAIVPRGDAPQGLVRLVCSARSASERRPEAGIHTARPLRTASPSHAMRA